MPSLVDEAWEWLDRAEQAREVAGQLTDQRARASRVKSCGKLRVGEGCRQAHCAPQTGKQRREWSS
jgi:hypothetical protein